MKKNYVFVVSLLIFSVSLACQAMAQFNYVNPKPGSGWQLPQTTIILRNGDLIDEYSLHNKNLIEITGSISGKHEWTAILSEGKTVIVKPNIVFNYGETVKVTVHSTLRKKDGLPIKGISFSFQIRNAVTPEEKQRYEQSDRELNREALGYDSYHQSAHPRTDYLDSMPTFTINININKKAAPGQIFYDNESDIDGDTNSFLTIINNDGSIVWARDGGPSGHDFKINYNGYLTYYDYVYNGWKVMDSNFNQIDSFQSVGYATNAHDMLMYPDKHIFVMGTDNRTIDMSQIVPGGQPYATVKGLVVQEFDSNKNVIFQWNSFDHFQITDADSNTSLKNLIVDYEHPNAFERDNDGNLLISSRNFCEITKISLATGDIIWRMGGENNQFTFVDDSIHFSYQHDIRRIANGHITLFNNGNYLSAQKSSANEYALDEVNKVATLIWYYEHPNADSTHVFGYAEGSVQRLSDGNTMICWGNIRYGKGIPNMSEVDSSKKITWEFTFDSSLQKSYRVHKYVWEPCPSPSFASLLASNITSTSADLSWTAPYFASNFKLQYKEITSATWITISTNDNTYLLTDLKPNAVYDWKVKAVCSAFSNSSDYSATQQFNTIASGISVLPESSFSFYPNPASDLLQLNFILQKSNEVQFSVTNVMGSLVFTNQWMAREGMNSSAIHLPAAASGIYLVTLKTDEQEYRSRLVIH